MRCRLKQYVVKLVKLTGMLALLWTLTVTAVLVLGSASHMKDIASNKHIKNQLEADLLNKSVTSHSDLVGKGTKKYKIILRWTPFYGNSWGVENGSEIFRNLGCPWQECVITDNRQDVLNADTVLVNIPDIHHPSELPGARRPSQTYIAYMLESPVNMATNLSLFNGVFNWTSTYRTHSTLPSPYGSTVPIKAKNTSSFKDLELQLYKEELEAWSRKSRLAAIFISNCKSQSGREHYIEQLRQHMKVDVYGSCGQHRCLDAQQCLHMLRDHYKFYLAFENSKCSEYITEKFWYNALWQGTIPVVLGPSRDDYERLAPPGSFIHVDDFESPQTLARFLRRLHRDFAMYFEYKKWQLHYEVRPEIRIKPYSSRMWCRLCQALYGQYPTSVTWDLAQHWSMQQQCIGTHSNRTKGQKGST